MRRVLAFFILLTGAIQFMGCGAEFLVQAKEGQVVTQAAIEEACSSCDSSPSSESPSGAATNHNCHLFCANHCASHHMVETVEIALLRDAPSRALTFGQLTRVSLIPQGSVFEPPRA